MSWLLVFLVCGFFILVFSQFGGRLAAANALGWWIISLFLVVAAVNPQVLKPLTHFLGIELVSNFVMAATIVFLFLQVIELSAAQTTATRKLRQLVTNAAARDFLEQHARPKTTATSQTGADPKTLVILPCYNEEAALPHLIPELQSLKAQSQGNIEFCFMDDGSSDSTRRLLRERAPQQYVSHLSNIGVSGALLTGFKIMLEAGFDYAVQCDGDGQHPIDKIAMLVATARRENADLLIASRFLASGTEQLASTTKFRRLGSLIIVAVIRTLWRGTPCTDPTSGFRVYSRRACQHLLKTMPDEYPEPESIALLSLTPYKLHEVGIEMQPRTSGSSSLGGWRSLRYMYKVITALLGLRLRSLLPR